MKVTRINSWMQMLLYLTNTLQAKTSQSKTLFYHCFSFYLIGTPGILGAVWAPVRGSTITCGSTGLSRGGVRAGCTLLILKDSERGGRLGSEILLATLCGIAGELWRLSRERSSTCSRRGDTEWLFDELGLLGWYEKLIFDSKKRLYGVLGFYTGTDWGPRGLATFTWSWTQLSSHKLLLQAINTTRKSKKEPPASKRQGSPIKSHFKLKAEVCQCIGSSLLFRYIRVLYD